MANASIFAAFERMWQYVTTALNDKANMEHDHDSSYYDKTTVDQKVNGVNTDLQSHKDSKNNPHGVTPAQIGAVAIEAGKGLSSNDYTIAEKNKLAGIADNANNYVHPSHTPAANGLYKVTVDTNGHVSATTAVTKGDITALGIPAQDTSIIEKVTVGGTEVGITNKTVALGSLAGKDEISIDDLDETANNLVMRGAVASIALGDFIQYSEADGYSADYVKEYIDNADTALSNRITTLEGSDYATIEDVQELLDGNKVESYDITLLIGGWKVDSAYEGYNYKYAYALNGITERSIANVSLDVASIGIASEAGVLSGVEAVDGYINFYAKEIPSENLTGTVYISVELPSQAIIEGFNPTEYVTKQELSNIIVVGEDEIIEGTTNLEAGKFYVVF